MPNVSLNFLERNRVLNALREGRSWEEATAFLPLSVNRGALASSFREHLTAEARKAAVTDPKPVRYDPAETAQLRAENAALKDQLHDLGHKAEALGFDLTAAQRDKEGLAEINDRLNKDLAETRKAVEALKVRVSEYEDLINDPKGKKK